MGGRGRTNRPMCEATWTGSAPGWGAGGAHAPVVPGYRLGPPLGRGGFGEVFAARGEAGRVAIKVLRADLARQREHVARFEREIRCLARLDHPSSARLI